MHTSALSTGQKQVREIANQIWADYPEINPQWTCKEYEPVYEELRNRLAADEIIKADEYTGCRIVETKGVAKAYFEFIKNNATKVSGRVQEYPMQNFDFNRMFFGGSGVYGHSGVQPDYTRKVYEGGKARPKTTARAVLNLVDGKLVPDLVAGKPVSPHQVTTDYYRNSGILQVINGNHRLLAYKLVGRYDFPIISSVWEEKELNETLNQALISLESLLPSYDYCIELENNQELAVAISSEFESHPILRRFTQYDLAQGVTSYRVHLEQLAKYANAYQSHATGRSFESGDKEEQQIRERLESWFSVENTT